MSETTPRSIGRTLWNFFSGYGLATSLLVLLGVLTWLATLEMVDAGLLATLNKYFHWSEPWVVPEINGKSLILPLPGGYWVCALLLVNMVLGGLIRARKGWKTVGVLISHFSIVFMVAAGGVAQWLEKRGVMFLIEGEQADYAVSLTDPSIEVFELKDGKTADVVWLAEPADLRGVAEHDSRLIRFSGLPFQIRISDWHENAVVRKGPKGWGLEARPLDPQAELHAQGCVAAVVPDGGEAGEPFVLVVPPVQSGFETIPPKTFEVDGRTFGVRLVKETIPVPYTVKLKDAVAEYFPNSGRPKSFTSDISKINGDSEVDIRISMNEPLRSGGFTFFQRTMSSGPPAPGQPEFSGFEVVSNPADRWPEWSLYLVTAGLLIHFIMKLVIHLGGGSRTVKVQ
jgi:hypothetical protein